MEHYAVASMQFSATWVEMDIMLSTIIWKEDKDSYHCIHPS